MQQAVTGDGNRRRTSEEGFVECQKLTIVSAQCHSSAFRCEQLHFVPHSMYCARATRTGHGEPNFHYTVRAPEYKCTLLYYTHWRVDTSDSRT